MVVFLYFELLSYNFFVFNLVNLSDYKLFNLFLHLLKMRYCMVVKSITVVSVQPKELRKYKIQLKKWCTHIPYFWRRWYFAFCKLMAQTYYWCKWVLTEKGDACWCKRLSPLIHVLQRFKILIVCYDSKCK